MKVMDANLTDAQAHIGTMIYLENNKIGNHDRQKVAAANVFDNQPRPFPQAVTTGTAVEK